MLKGDWDYYCYSFADLVWVGLLGNIVVIGILVAAFVGYGAYRQQQQGKGKKLA